jgi:DNA polymerase III subunit chi
MTQVDFYIVNDTAPDAHLRQACRLAEAAVDTGQRVFMRVQDDAQARRIDDLLWTFGDQSFLPHEIAESPSHERVRVLIGSHIPKGFADLLINIGHDAVSDLNASARIAELVPAGDELKRQARVRFKTYRDAGIEPATKSIEGA